MNAVVATQQAQQLISALMNPGAGLSNTGRNFSLPEALGGQRQPGPFSTTQRTDYGTVTLSQADGAGSPVAIQIRYSSGALQGNTARITFDPVTERQSVEIPQGDLSQRERDLISWVAEQGLEMLMGMNQKSKKRNSGNATASAGQGTPGGAMEVDGRNGGDIFDGDSIDANGFFLALAKGMGDTLNKLAEKIMQKLQDIKSQEGTNPDGTNKAAPFSDTAEFQALSQTLAYMQNAFMTTMNAFGDAIKKGVEAGGALR
jgi:hypothetical protein